MENHFQALKKAIHIYQVSLETNLKITPNDEVMGSIQFPGFRMLEITNRSLSIFEFFLRMLFLRLSSLSCP